MVSVDHFLLLRLNWRFISGKLCLSQCDPESIFLKFRQQLYCIVNSTSKSIVLKFHQQLNCIVHYEHLYGTLKNVCDTGIEYQNRKPNSIHFGSGGPSSYNPKALSALYSKETLVQSSSQSRCKRQPVQEVYNQEHSQEKVCMSQTIIAIRTIANRRLH